MCSTQLLCNSTLNTFLKMQILYFLYQSELKNKNKKETRQKSFILHLFRTKYYILHGINLRNCNSQCIIKYNNQQHSDRYVWWLNFLWSRFRWHLFLTLIWTKQYSTKHWQTEKHHSLFNQSYTEIFEKVQSCNFDIIEIFCYNKFTQDSAIHVLDKL